MVVSLKQEALAVNTNGLPKVKRQPKHKIQFYTDHNEFTAVDELAKHYNVPHTTIISTAVYKLIDGINRRDGDVLAFIEDHISNTQSKYRKTK